MPHVLQGKVLLSSGALLAGNRILDWAFIELTSTATENFSVNKLPEISREKRPEMYGKSGNGLLLDQFGELRKGDYFLKVGRSTEVTAGICNGALAYCNWDDTGDRVRYDAHGNAVMDLMGCTGEFVILDKKRWLATYEQASFCEPGDSSSFIINARRDMCGFCGLPGNRTLYPESGLATSMPDILESIRSRSTPNNESGNPSGPPATLGLPS
ncbi:hypothetical protein V8E54_004909 [Elaphomyces granulatus]